MNRCPCVHLFYFFLCFGLHQLLRNISHFYTGTQGPQGMNPNDSRATMSFQDFGKILDELPWNHSASFLCRIQYSQRFAHTFLVSRDVWMNGWKRRNEIWKSIRPGQLPVSRTICSWVLWLLQNKISTLNFKVTISSVMLTDFVPSL